MTIWDLTTPTGSEGISNGDNRIRELKDAIQDALRAGTTEGLSAIFPGNAPTTAPVFHYRGLRGATASRPVSGQSGLYFDTTRQSLQRDNSTTWEDIGTNFPAGTIMLFCQASAPTGWTKITTQNDKTLRIISGATGGTAGGTLGLSGGIPHTHILQDHDHDIAQASIEHKHKTTVAYASGDGLMVAVIGNVFGLSGDPNGSSGATFAGSGAIGAGYQYQLSGGVESYANLGTNGSGSLVTNETTPILAYVDVIQASKD